MAFQKRRCVVAVSGFFEWKRSGKAKQAYYITRADGHPLGMAGLWESWSSADGEVVESCTVITKPPVAPMVQIHNRMPAILTLDRADGWLDDGEHDRDALRGLLLAPSPDLTAVAVSSYVNSVAHQGSECIGVAADA